MSSVRVFNRGVARSRQDRDRVFSGARRIPLILLVKRRVIDLMRVGRTQCR